MSDENLGTGCCGCLTLLVGTGIFLRFPGPITIGIVGFIALGLLGLILQKLGLIKDDEAEAPEETKTRPTTKTSLEEDEADEPEDDGEFATEFIETLFASLGKLAKADGVVKQSEANHINDFIREMGLSAKEKALAGKSFKAALDNAVSYQFYIDKLNEGFAGDRTHLQLILGLYCEIAISDGVLHDNEKRFIEYAEKVFGLNGYAHAFFGENHHNKSSSDRNSHHSDSLEAYYNILGCTPHASDDELKKAYRKKCIDFHPDKIESKGLPEEFKRFAEEEMKKINQAYDRIRQHRAMA